MQFQTNMKFSFKRYLIALVLLATISFWSISQAAGLIVPKDLTVESSDAKRRQVPILVLFMSESCEYCETVLKQFLLPMQRDPEYDDKVILRQIESSSGDALIDFDGKATTYRRFSSRHKVWGTPHVMLFDSNGQVLTSIEGLLTVDFYYAFLVNAIEESLEKIKGGNY